MVMVMMAVVIVTVVMAMGGDGDGDGDGDGGGVWGRCLIVLIIFLLVCTYVCVCARARQETNRRKKAREKFLKKKQLEDPLATLTPEEEAQFQTSDITKYPRIPGTHTPHTHHTTPHTSQTSHTGYVGSPKGAKQMLWELGHWQPGLTLACCKRILRQLPDFKLETSELSNLWRSRGHGFEVGVKCHPEMAGCGLNIAGARCVCACLCVFVCFYMCVRFI